MLAENWADYVEKAIKLDSKPGKPLDRTVLSDEYELVLLWQQYVGFMQHRVGATPQRQLHVEP